MWFRNVRFYTLSEPLVIPANFAERLQEHAYRPCNKQELAQLGWVSPFSLQHELLFHSIGDNHLLSLRKEEKVLPTSAVNARLDERVAEISATEGRPVNRKEKQTLKEDLIHAMLPQAFSKYQQTSAFINTQLGFIAIDASSANKAEELLGLLRGTLSSLPVKPLMTQNPVELFLTQWLQTQQLPGEFEFGDEIELKSQNDDGAVVRCKQQDLTSSEVLQHLEHGKQVTKLGLIWSDRLSFVLENDIALKRFKLTDVAENDRDDLVDPTPEQRVDADFALLSAEINSLYPALVDALSASDHA